MDRRQSNAWGVVLAVTMGMPALGLLAGAAWLSLDNLRVLARYHRSEGHVASIEHDRSGARFAVHRLEVRFRPCPEPAPPAAGSHPFDRLGSIPRFADHPGSACDPRGETAPRRVVVSAHGTTRLQPGDRVTVHWHPDHPRDVRVGAFSTFWATPVVLALIGGALGWNLKRLVRDLRAERQAGRTPRDLRANERHAWRRRP